MLGGPAADLGAGPVAGELDGPDCGVLSSRTGAGMGWLARHDGLAADSVRAIELVTADGVEVRSADRVSSELFRALRGGGARTLGVVTGIEVGLHPVSTVYAGNLFYPASAARDVYRFFARWTRDTDEEMTSAVTLINFPPLPDVPDPLRGERSVLVRGAYCGTDLDRGRELVDRWRAWRTPELDHWGPMPFAQSDMISMDPVDPLPALLATEWFDAFHENAMDVVVEATFAEPGRQPNVLFAELRHAGGAGCRLAAGVPRDRSRSGEYLLHLVSVPPIPDAIPALEAHLRYTREKLRPYVSGAAYEGFLDDDDGDDDDDAARASHAFSPTNHARLRRVKVALDPENRFGFGFGIA